MTKAEIVDLVIAHDERGLLTAAQYQDQLPFLPMRIFTVSQSPLGTERGGHAHRTCHQFLIAIKGPVRVEYDDSEGTSALTLTDPRQGLYIPPLVWALQTYLADSAALLVLASEAYSVSDYIDSRTEAAHLRSL